MIDLEPIKARVAEATPGPWTWNSYSGIWAEVDPGHPLDMCPEGELNVNGKKLAAIAWIDGGPEQSGDELCVEEAKANAIFIEHSYEDILALIAEVERLRESLAMLASDDQDFGHYGHNGLYGDDGEMQCGYCGLDFKRSSIELLTRVLAKQPCAAKLLHELTPMGSEFVGDPQRCYEWIRDRMSSLLTSGTGHAIAAERRCQELERALQEMADLLEETRSGSPA